MGNDHQTRYEAIESVKLDKHYAEFERYITRTVSKKHQYEGFYRGKKRVAYLP